MFLLFWFWSWLVFGCWEVWESDGNLTINSLSSVWSQKSLINGNEWDWIWFSPFFFCWLVCFLMEKWETEFHFSDFCASGMNFYVELVQLCLIWVLAFFFNSPGLVLFGFWENVGKTKWMETRNLEFSMFAMKKGDNPPK